MAAVIKLLTRLTTAWFLNRFLTCKTPVEVLPQSCFEWIYEYLEGNVKTLKALE
jgi:hypothetical protein